MLFSLDSACILAGVSSMIFCLEKCVHCFGFSREPATKSLGDWRRVFYLNVQCTIFFAAIFRCHVQSTRYTWVDLPNMTGLEIQEVLRQRWGLQMCQSWMFLTSKLSTTYDLPSRVNMQPGAWYV